MAIHFDAGNSLVPEYEDPVLHRTFCQLGSWNLRGWTRRELGNREWENVSGLSTVPEFSRKQAQKARYHSMKTSVLAFFQRGHWSVYHNLAYDGYIEFTCCCVQARFLDMETKIFLSLLWYIYSALFYNVFKAFNFFLPMAMAMWLPSISLQSSDMTWHWWLTSQNGKTVACSWAFFSNPGYGKSY